MSYKFRVGQTVQFVAGSRYVTMSAIGYKVVRQLRESGGERSYRIKSAHESFERVVIESSSPGDEGLRWKPLEGSPQSCLKLIDHPGDRSARRHCFGSHPDDSNGAPWRRPCPAETLLC